MESIHKQIEELPPDLQKEVGDFVEFLAGKKTRKLRGKPKFGWAGTLKDLCKQYTSVELQHKISNWRNGDK